MWGSGRICSGFPKRRRQRSPWALLLPNPCHLGLDTEQTEESHLSETLGPYLVHLVNLTSLSLSLSSRAMVLTPSVSSCFPHRLIVCDSEAKAFIDNANNQQLLNIIFPHETGFHTEGFQLCRRWV